MRYPKFIKAGDTIGFVAPSFGCTFDPYKTSFEHGLKKFKALGYESQLGPNVYKEDGIGISTNPKDCGAELTDMYGTDKNQALISCGGGELMCEVIPYVDWEKIKVSEPKWYSGYSDNTNFTFLVTTLCDTASIYGPCAPSFGMEPWHKSLSDTFALLEGKCDSFHNYDLWECDELRDAEHPLLPFNVTEPVVMESFTGDCAFSGRLIGGCMDCLVNFLGTEYDKVAEFNEKYKEDGIIWYLEACDLTVMGIRRAIWQMQHAGWFKYVKGFMIGRPVCHGSEVFGINHKQAVTDLLQEYNVPILMDLDIGHLKPSIPIVNGGTADVTFKNNELEIKYTWK